MGNTSVHGRKGGMSSKEEFLVNFYQYIQYILLYVPKFIPPAKRYRCSLSELIHVICLVCTSQVELSTRPMPKS